MRSVFPIVLAVALGACGGSSSQPSSDSLVSVSDEPAGANCPAGGTAIRTGADDDGDGGLDPGEITQVQYICKDSSGLAQLVSAEDEPAGANCPTGGTALRIGTDRDGDRVLDADEIEQVRYVCSGARGESGRDGTNGHDGADGEDGRDGTNGRDGTDGMSSLIEIDDEPPGDHCPRGGHAVRIGPDRDRDGALDPDEVLHVRYLCRGDETDQPLVRLDEEPAGAHCRAGGVAIRSGLDTDRDRVLDDTEITDTQYVCRASRTTIFGHYRVENQIDAEVLLGVTQVTGDLIVEAPGLPSLDLTTLERVGGDLSILQTAVARVDLPALTSVGGGLRIYDNAAMTEIAAPVLSAIGGELRITTNPVLTRVHTPAVGRIGGNLVFVQNPAATSLRLDVEALGDVHVSSNDALTAVELPMLTTSGAVRVETHAALATLRLPALQTVRGELAIVANPALATLDLAALTTIDGSLQLNDNSHIAALRAPLATCGNIEILRNAALAAVELPALTTSGSLQVAQDEHLATLALPALTTVRGALTIHEAPIAELVLPRLTQLDSAWLRSTAVTRVIAPLVTRLPGGLSLQDNAALARVDFAALEEMGAALWIFGTAPGATVDFGHLARAHTPWEGYNGVQLEHVDLAALALPALVSASGIAISHSRIGDVSLDRLAETHALALRDSTLGVVTAPHALAVKSTLAIERNTLARLVLTGLTTVSATNGFESSLSIVGNVIADGSLELPALETVQSTAVIADNRLEGGRISLPRYVGQLRWGGRDSVLRISGNGVAAVVLGALRGDGEMTPVVTIAEDRATTIVLDALEYASSLTVSGGATALQLPALRRIEGALTIENGQLTAVNAPRLLWVRGDFTVRNNARLDRLDGFPTLFEIGRLRIEDNTVLRAFEFPLIESLQGVAILRNRALPTCAARAFASRFPGIPVDIAGNDDQGSCSMP